jgi:hypothetical protein
MNKAQLTMQDKEGKYAIKGTPWVQTYMDIQFNPLSIKEEDISILDIAHALSHTCRWGGHCNRFYSVAQHSVMVSEMASPENKLAALLHDASEAYIGDMPSPLKALMPDYKELEKTIQTAIQRKYGIADELPEEIHEIDRRVCIWEAHNLLYDTNLVRVWGGDNPDPDKPLRPVTSETAKHLFLFEFNKLTGQR